MKCRELLSNDLLPSHRPVAQLLFECQLVLMRLPLGHSALPQVVDGCQLLSQLLQAVSLAVLSHLVSELVIVILLSEYIVHRAIELEGALG